MNVNFNNSNLKCEEILRSTSTINKQNELEKKVAELASQFAPMDLSSFITEICSKAKELSNDDICFITPDSEDEEQFKNIGMLLVAGQIKLLGYFQNGKLNGPGQAFCGEGIYYGYFKNNELNGLGKIRTIEGDIHEGHFEGNKLNGLGYIQLINGDVYRGYFKDDKLNGPGCIIYSDGDVYKGIFENDDLKVGEIQLASGCVYKGKFVNDRLNGEGEFINKYGFSIRGIFSDGKYISHT